MHVRIQSVPEVPQTHSITFDRIIQIWSNLVYICERILSYVCAKFGDDWSYRRLFSFDRSSPVFTWTSALLIRIFKFYNRLQVILGHFSPMKKVDDNSNHHQTWHKHSLGTLTYVYQISSNLNNPIKSYGVCPGTSDSPCIFSYFQLSQFYSNVSSLSIRLDCAFSNERLSIRCRHIRINALFASIVHWTFVNSYDRQITRLFKSSTFNCINQFNTIIYRRCFTTFDIFISMADITLPNGICFVVQFRQRSYSSIELDSYQFVLQI